MCCDVVWQAVPAYEMIQKAYAVATEISQDPFAGKRDIGGGLELMTPLFTKFSLHREGLTASATIGFGQASTILFCIVDS